MDIYTQAFLTALALSGVAFLIGRVIVHVGERAIEAKHGAPGMRDRLVACAKLETALEARKGDLAKQIKDSGEASQEATRRRSTLDRRLREAISAGEALIRVIGEESRGTPCFHAEVNNKYVGNANFDQREHAYIDSSWAQPQVMEIWARSIAEARAEIERRYPPAFGYNISRLLDIGSVDAAKPANQRQGG